MLDRSAQHPYLPLKDPDAMFRVWTYRVLQRTASDAEEGFEAAVREAFERADPVVKLDHHWIWDSRASELYERYTQSDGYYLTDCEESILRAHADEIHGDEPLIVELGCGSARKIAHVLEARLDAAPDEELAYMPIDVSRGAVRETEAAVLERFGDRVRVEPRMGLFEQVLESIPRDRNKLVFFFGSSIGNFDTLEATVAFLRDLGSRLAPGDRLVLGTDLHKELDVLERAYNEEETCRSFFVHMLRRVNEHLGADFDPRVFELSSTYELEPEWQGLRTRRMNLRVKPRVPQRTFVQELDREATLDDETPVQVGISRKFEPEQVQRLGELAGLEPGRQWLDARGWFALTELRRGADDGRRGGE
jgi:L-histidine N-alpha-methyltransferase